MNHLDTITINDKPFYFRDGSSDSIILKANILCNPHEREYKLPSIPGAKTIIDIGANIGVISVLMANIYPDATIHSFEPVTENFEILKKNTELYPNIKLHHFALASETGSLPIFKSSDSRNYGGSSLENVEGVSPVLREVIEEVLVCDINTVLSGLEIDKIDLIKIDCEGSEFEILTALNPKILTKTTAILGELHGHKDFQLLDYLSQYFHLSFEKNLYDKTYQFRALIKV